MIDISPVEGMMSVSDRELFWEWCRFLESEVDFSDPRSELHTRDHCARVLLYSILISRDMPVGRLWRDALCLAAVFHDCRRLDDGPDVGHGARAAQRYLEHCEENETPFYLATHIAMSYHDRDDADGEAAMRDKGLGEDAVLMYRVLKDADALDRFRLGPNGLDPRFLRTDEARGLVETARGFTPSPGGRQ